ncbi:hypothetical protein NUW54_g9782 [Trametes sanguinea]|uniref:Uncharacterized protein n=1 Tax=Trametes sanguinea TaxID=158606 RepID=A0ACC1P5S6_9APHY|nr:hypothetical protein NUW54_g9782 [Trametes sanguinea]
MALGGLGAVLLSGHPSLSPSHVISQVDLRSVFFAVVFVIIVLVLAYLTNPSETSFRTYLTEQSFKQHLSRLDDGGTEEGAASDDSGLHFTLSRRTPPSTRKSGSNFDPTSPFHFVSRASVSLRTPKHVFYSFGILTIAAVYPTGRPHARGTGHTIPSENLGSSVSDAWFIGAFGRWWKGGVIQSWWHDMLATPKDAERGGSGILDVKALDILEGYDGESKHVLPIFLEANPCARSAIPDPVAHALPADHYMDTPLSPTAKAPAGQPSVSPFLRLPSLPKPRPSIYNGAANPSPFGTLNVPGNALLPDSSTGTITPVSPPSFQFEQDDITPTTPVSAPNPFASFANGSVYADPSPGDYLQPPTATILARRTSVSAESIPVDSETNEPLPVFPKTDDQLRRIRASIANNFIFRDLDEEQETGVLNAMQECRVVENEVVIRQGDVGEYFYVVESGLLHCYIRPEPLPPQWLTGRIASADEFKRPGWHPEFGEKVAECREGSSFGELALMYGHPRAATVLAIEPSTLWSLDRITFRTIILKAAHRRRTMYEQFLSSVPLLVSLRPEERSKIADALVSRVYDDGEAVQAAVEVDLHRVVRSQLGLARRAAPADFLLHVRPTGKSNCGSRTRKRGADSA